MQTLLEGLFNEGSLQRREEEDRTQWTHAQESMMEVFEECSRRGDKERVSEIIRTEKKEKGQLGLLQSLKYGAPAHYSVAGKRNLRQPFFTEWRREDRLTLADEE